MKIKLATKPRAGAADALNRWIRPLYATPGMRVVGVIEIAHLERTEPAPDSDREPVVTVQITGLEIGMEDQEHHLRQAMQALHLHRTAYGTLDESGHIDLSDRTIELTAGVLHAVEAARLKALVEHWGSYARKASGLSKPTTTELLHELAAIADGLQTAIYNAGDGTD